MIITTNLKLSELKNPPDLAHARIYAVSYTHLDVYKRQAVNWNIGTCSCSLVLAVVISAILILCMKEREAVSYTHLDVYKRQL